MKNNFKAVIFDLDGTLLNSLEDISDAVNGMLVECGYPTHSYDEYRYNIGNGFRNLVGLSLPLEARSEENIARCSALGMKIYENLCVAKTRPYDGIEAMLDRLVVYGCKIAILSNKPDPLTQKTVEVLLSKWDFEFVLGASDRFPRKPNPESALYLAREMGVTPEEIVYIGDSDVDMKTAC